MLKIDFCKIRRFISTYLLLSMLIFSANSSTPAQMVSQDEQINVSVYENVSPSIVAIDADISDGISSGTGCVIDPKGIILTSSHVIDGANTIEVILYNGEKCTGKLIKIMEENSDLALLKINTTSLLPVIKFGDSTKIKVGQKVLAIGNPFGFNRTLTTGIISRIDYDRNKIQTDAAINPGSSGGPLLNVNGEVIGINQSIYNPDNNKSNIGIGFAVPVNAAKRFIVNSKNDINEYLSKNNEKSTIKNN